MTAPLPEVNLPEGDYLEKDAYVQQYAKAAVREALERVYVELAVQSCRCPNKVRAMLKEYSDD